MLKDEALSLTNTDDTAIIQQHNILYNLNPSRLGINKEINKDDFTSLLTEGENVIITGYDLINNTIEIQFAVKLDSSWTELLAGRYLGEVIFTIKEIEH